MTPTGPAIDDPLSAAVAAAGWRLPPWLPPMLSPYERDFMRIEMTGQRTRDYYARRLQMIGFAGGERVLDAACGIGQWSLALAENYRHVEGVDINPGRLLVARALAAEQGRSNCTFAYAPLEQLPQADGSFDAIFCYGAFMFTDMPRTLREFRRVLKPGGRVYLNANSTGWYAHLLIDRGLKKRSLSMVRSALTMIRRTLWGHTSQIVVRESWLVRELQRAGLKVHALGAEGTLQLTPGVVPVPAAYPPKYYGRTSILELVAER